MIEDTDTVTKQTETINGALEEYIPRKDNPQGEIYDAMRYSLFAGGKRLRPILMWECAKLCGGGWDDIKPFACAIEMIHTYSLIHDDLPAMDNDDLRRGLPTNHIKFGEAAAILAGDALLNKAFEVVSEFEYDSPAAAMRAMRVLAHASGTEGMIGGQVSDLKSEGRKITLNELKYIHALKTGALIRAACVIGAIMAGADEKAVSAVDGFAANLGIAFQIRDDILDVQGSEEELGKPIGSDIESDKNTYVSVLGTETSQRLVREYSDKAEAMLEPFGDGAKRLKQLTKRLVARRK